MPESQTMGTERSGWGASLAFDCNSIEGKSTVTSRCHAGPLQIQRSFYPEGPGCCHVYLLHPPGGIVGGDRLRVDASIRPGAHVLLTTPAASKLYRSERRVARQTQHFRLAAKSRLEWLPAETIAFDGAWADLTTRVQIEDGAVFMGWEILCLGRPACAERFIRGVVTQSFEVYQNDDPLWIERGRYAGDARVLREPWGLHGSSIAAVFVCTPPVADADLVVRAALALHGDVTCSVSTLRHALVCRVLGDNTADVRKALESAWTAPRPLVIGRPASPPRIWRT